MLQLISTGKQLDSLRTPLRLGFLSMLMMPKLLAGSADIVFVRSRVATLMTSKRLVLMPTHLTLRCFALGFRVFPSVARRFATVAWLRKVLSPHGRLARAFRQCRAKCSSEPGRVCHCLVFKEQAPIEKQSTISSNFAGLEPLNFRIWIPPSS